MLKKVCGLPFCTFIWELNFPLQSKTRENCESIITQQYVLLLKIRMRLMRWWSWSFTRFGTFAASRLHATWQQSIPLTTKFKEQRATVFYEKYFSRNQMIYGNISHLEISQKSLYIASNSWGDFTTTNINQHRTYSLTS